MSDDGANNDRSVKIPNFVEKKFQVFRMEFKAVAAIKEFAEGFKSKFTTREDTPLDLAVTNEKAQSKAKVKKAITILSGLV